MPDVGDLIGDRYRLADRIAAGGMGDVWCAVDETLHRTVAVKMMHGRFIEEASTGERFRREARAMAALRHPGVAEVYDYGETAPADAPGLAYIVMAYVDGQPLSERIAEAGRLGTAETLSIITQTARALQAAHDVGVVHRDVKPSNLIIEPDGRVVLVDFGIATSPQAPQLTAANQVVGTALYMAPEQLSRTGITPATDIYALGAVAYHCLAGRPPFTGDNAIAVAVRRLEEDPPPLPDDVPPAVRDLVATAMAREPERRYPTAAAMAVAAETAAGPTTASTALLAVPPAPRPSDPTTLGEPAAARPRRGAGRRALVAVALVSVATAAAATVLADGTGWSPGRSDVPSPPAGTSRPADGGGDPARTPDRSRTGGQDPDAATSAAPATAPATRDTAPSRSTAPAPSTAAPTPEESDPATEGPTAEPTDEPESPPASPAARSTRAEVVVGDGAPTADSGHTGG